MRRETDIKEHRKKSSALYDQSRATANTWKGTE
jgi:hypothetical protein